MTHAETLRQMAASYRHIGRSDGDVKYTEQALALEAGARALAALERSPLPLNEGQERAVKEWAADDRLWTTQETVEANLRTFARVILKEWGCPLWTPR